MCLGMTETWIWIVILYDLLALDKSFHLSEMFHIWLWRISYVHHEVCWELNKKIYLISRLVSDTWPATITIITDIMSVVYYYQDYHL